MDVLIRTDASVEIGSGHLMRCLTLAASLRARGAAVSFICRELSGQLCALAESEGFAVLRLAAPDAGSASVDWRTDAAQCAALLAGRARADWLVVDHYGLDARWETALRAAAERIMVIDDLADRPHDCEVLLDQNYHPDGAARYDARLPASCLRLLGPGYALLRPQFGQARTRARARDGSVRRILVFFGGSDPGNETAKALEALRLLGPDQFDADVVIGASNPYAVRIERACAALPWVSLHCQVSNMAQLMQEADLYLGAGGSSSWERCCVGLPGVVVAVAANQLEVSRALAGQGCQRFLGAAAEVTPQQIAHALGQLRDSEAVRAMAARAAALVDGQGSARVAECLCGPAAGPDLSGAIGLRYAGIDDELSQFEWRNASHVRAASFNPQPIPWERHQSWFRAVLADPGRHLLIAECGGQAVGVLRYDVTGQEAEVSVFLRSGLSGQGLGTRVLRAGSGWLEGRLPGLTQVRARIMPGNPASRGAFLKAGYVACGEDYIFELGSQ